MFEKGGGGRDLPSVDVQYFPLQVCALTSTAFVLPANSAAASKSRYSFLDNPGLTRQLK